MKRNGDLGVEEKDKKDEVDIPSVPRNIDYQIAGIIAGGLSGLLIYFLSQTFNIPIFFNQPSLVIIFAVFGYFLFKPIMRFLR